MCLQPELHLLVVCIGIVHARTENGTKGESDLNSAGMAEQETASPSTEGSGVRGRGTETALPCVDTGIPNCSIVDCYMTAWDRSPTEAEQRR